MQGYTCKYVLPFGGEVRVPPAARTVPGVPLVLLDAAAVSADAFAAAAFAAAAFAVAADVCRDVDDNRRLHFAKR